MFCGFYYVCAPFSRSLSRRRVNLKFQIAEFGAPAGAGAFDLAAVAASVGAGMSERLRKKAIYTLAFCRRRLRQVREVLADDLRLAARNRFVFVALFALRNFNLNRCLSRAGSLTFSSLLAIVPLFAVVVSIATGILQNQGTEKTRELTKHVFEYVAPQLKEPEPDETEPGSGQVEDEQEPMVSNAQPDASPDVEINALGNEADASDDEVSDLDRLVDRIATFVSNARTAKVTSMGIAALLFVVISMMITIESTFNDIWGVEKGRSWFTRLVQYWTTLSIGSVMVFLAMGLDLTSQSTTVETWVKGLPFVGEAIVWFFTRIVPIFFVFVGFSVIYKTMPNTIVNWSSAFVGGAVGAILWMGNNVSGVFISGRLERDRAIYDSFSLVPILMLALYLFWLILLFGAQVAYAFQFRNTHLLERRAAAFGTLERETAGLAILGEIASRFQIGRGFPKLEELSARLELPEQLVRELLGRFKAARLVDPVGEEGAGFALHRPASSIRVMEILEAIRNGASGRDHDRLPEKIRNADSILGELRQAESTSADGRTLADLVRS